MEERRKHFINLNKKITKVPSPSIEKSDNIHPQLSVSQSSILTKESDVEQLAFNINKFIEQLQENKEQRRSSLGFYNYQINFINLAKKSESNVKQNEYKKRINLRSLFRKEKNKFIKSVKENKERILKLEQYVYRSQSPNGTQQIQVNNTQPFNLSILRTGSNPTLFEEKKEKNSMCYQPYECKLKSQTSHNNTQLKKSVSMVNSLSIFKNPIGKSLNQKKSSQIYNKWRSTIQERLNTNESNLTKQSKKSGLSKGSKQSNNEIYKKTIEQVQKKLEVLQKKNKY